MPAKKRRGRPRLKGKVTLALIRLDQKAQQDAARLGKKWDTQRNETIRRSLRKTAEQELGQ
jgi:hypothetical protein